MKYTKTPSFYNNEEYFAKYLGRTSYYLGLQNVLNKIIKISSPSRILELGCAIGTTVYDIWGKNRIPIDGVDMREDVVDIAISNNIEDNKHIKFHCSEMREFVEQSDMTKWDFIYLLYSFHHIVDPLSNKEEFLRLCYDKIEAGTIIAILETFLSSNSQMNVDDSTVLPLFERRCAEGYASVFWDSLNNLDKSSIDKSKDIAAYTSDNESIAGDLVRKRDNEYLVTTEWLTTTAKRIGYDIILCEPVNSVGEHVVLLKKQ